MPESINALNDRLSRRFALFGELGGLGDIVVKNKEWLYMLSEETRNSLSIEGYFATKDQLDAAIQGKKTTPEVLNYFNTAQSAYDLALQQYRERAPVFVETYHVKHFHSELFRGVDTARGAYRVGGIQIQQAKVKPPAEDIEVYVSAFVDFARQELQETPDHIRALARIHSMFESIHPFRDGNGRAGRILLNYLAVGRGYPAIIIKGMTKEERDSYYGALEAADIGMHASFPDPNVQAFQRVLDRGSTEALERLIYESLILSIDPLIVAAMERKEPLVDFGTLAPRMSVKESTVRKWVQRNQLVTARRGRKFYSHPRLYLGDVGSENADLVKHRLEELINILSPHVRSVTIDDSKDGATFYAQRVVKLYIANVATIGARGQYALFAHSLLVDESAEGLPPIEDLPHANVTMWTDDEIMQFVLFPSSGAATMPNAIVDRVNLLHQNYLINAFYPLVNTYGWVEMIAAPVNFLSTRLPQNDLRKIMSQTQLPWGDKFFPASSNATAITNISGGIRGVIREESVREAFVLDSSGLFSVFHLFPHDKPNDTFDSPNRKVGVLYAVQLVSLMLEFARKLSRRTLTGPQDELYLGVTFGGLQGRVLFDDTGGHVGFESRPPGHEHSAVLSVVLSARQLDAMFDEIAVEAVKQLFWVLNHDEITTATVASLRQVSKDAEASRLSPSEESTNSAATSGFSRLSRPQMSANIQIGERRDSSYFLTGEIRNIGQSTALDIRATFPRLPTLIKSELRAGESWEIRQLYDVFSTDSAQYQPGVIEFSDSSLIFRQETVVDLSVLPGGNVRGYKVRPLTPPVPVDEYSIPK